jgi:hypothetical protein
VLWVQAAVGIVIYFPVSELLERYAARRGDSGYRVRKLASNSGVFLGAGIAVLFTNLQAALLLLAVGGASTTFFLLWFRRPRVGPPRIR